MDMKLEPLPNEGRTVNCNVKLCRAGCLCCSAWILTLVPVPAAEPRARAAESPGPDWLTRSEAFFDAT